MELIILGLLLVGAIEWFHRARMKEKRRVADWKPSFESDSPRSSTAKTPRAQQIMGRGTRSSVRIVSSQASSPATDDGISWLNPTNPLSPLSPLHSSSDHSHHHSSSPSHDSGHSYHDSGHSYDSGSSDDFGGGGGDGGGGGGD